MRRGARSLLKLTKKTLGKSIHKKLKKIKDKEELKETLKHATISSLKKEYHSMEVEIKKLENQKKDVFFARTKLLLLPSKIKYLQANFDEEEFERVTKSFKLVQKEIENV